MDKKYKNEARKKSSLPDVGKRKNPQSCHPKDCKSKEGATQYSKSYNPRDRIFLPCSHYLTLSTANKQAIDSLCTTVTCVMCQSRYPISVLESEAKTDSLSNPKCNQNIEKTINTSFVQDKNKEMKMKNNHVWLQENGKSSNKNFTKKISQDNSIPSQSDIRKNSRDDSVYQPHKKKLSQWKQGYGNEINAPYIQNKNSAVNIESKIVVDENYSNEHIAYSEKSYNSRNQGNYFKGPSKRQQSDYASFKKEPIVNEKNNTHFSNKNAFRSDGCENNSNYSCSSLNNVSKGANNNMSGNFKAHDVEHLTPQMGCEESLSSLKQTVNRLKYNENHNKGAFSNEIHSSLQMDATISSMHPNVIQTEMALVENVKETIRNQTENATVYCGTSKAVLSRPIPATRHIKSDGKTLVASNSSTLIPNSPSSNNGESHSAFSEKGAIKKTNNLGQINNNLKRASGFEYKNFISDKLSDELILYMCIDCSKSVPQKICKDHVDKGHKVKNMEDGIDILMNKELRTIKSMQNDIQNKFFEIHRHDATLDASINILSEVFKSFKMSQMHPDSQKEKGNQILYQMQEISGKCVSMESPTTFLEYENLRHSVQKTKIQAETWHEENNHMIPFWLISSWLKNSIAILLSGVVSQGKDIFVVKGKKGEEMAKLCFLGNRLFLSPFLKNVTTKEDDYFIKHELVEPIFGNEVSLAFMKISYGNQEPSETIIIRINTATFFGKQFLLMCTSGSGNSFLGTKFFRNNWIGKEGHHIWGGDYSNNDGSGGSVVLLDKDVSLEGPPLPPVEGMIASRYGYKDRSTIFRIYMQGSKSGFRESCAFAQIEEGIDILQCAAMMGDITKVIIVDVGIVAELI